MTFSVLLVIFVEHSNAICDRWKVIAQPGHEPRAFSLLCEHSTTELLSHPVISPTTFHLTPTRLHKHYIWGTYLRLTYDKIVEKKQTKQSKANHLFSLSSDDCISFTCGIQIYWWQGN